MENIPWRLPNLLILLSHKVWKTSLKLPWEQAYAKAAGQPKSWKKTDHWLVS